MATTLPQALDALAKAAQELASNTPEGPQTAMLWLTVGLLVANIALVVATFRLVVATSRYVRLTEKSVKAADDSAKAAIESATAAQDLAGLTRQQFMAASAPMIMITSGGQSGGGPTIWTVTLKNEREGVALRPDLSAYAWLNGSPVRGDRITNIPPAIHGGTPVSVKHHMSPAAWREQRRVVVICHYVDKYHAEGATRVYHSVHDYNKDIGWADPTTVQDYYWPERPLPAVPVKHP